MIKLHDPRTRAVGSAFMKVPFFDNLEFRSKVTASDAAAVASLAKDSGNYIPEEIRIAGELVQEHLAKGPDSGYHFLFAEAEGRILGYCCHGPIPATRSSHQLYWTVMDRRLRGNSVAAALMLKVEEAIRKAGGTRIYIATSSRMQYAAIRAFYSTCGYVRDAVLRDYFRHGENLVYYRKDLPA